MLEVRKLVVYLRIKMKGGFRYFAIILGVELAAQQRQVLMTYFTYLVKYLNFYLGITINILELPILVKTFFFFQK